LTLSPAGLLQALAVSLGTATILAYIELVLIILFLVCGALIIYVYHRRHKKEEALAPVVPSSA
jgi:uncharacterized membrane protein YoaK (UPF0700 family)